MKKLSLTRKNTEDLYNSTFDIRLQMRSRKNFTNKYEECKCCIEILPKPKRAKPHYSQSYNFLQIKRELFFCFFCEIAAPLSVSSHALFSYRHNLPHKGVSIAQKSRCRQGINPSMQESHAIAFTLLDVITKSRLLDKLTIFKRQIWSWACSYSHAYVPIDWQCMQTVHKHLMLCISC